jgi:hypothetical protein
MRHFVGAIAIVLLVVLTHSDLPANGGHGNGWTASRPDGHAPIGVMGEHTHGAGEWMLSYRYMIMDMDGIRDRTDSLGTNDVFDQGFMVAPKEMTMQMHMVGAMYAPTDRLTLMAMLPYILKSMDHVTQMGMEFTTDTEGIGDIPISALYLLHRWGNQQVLLNAGVSLPTGSINERDDTPAGDDQRLPYPMQLGSGTFDLLPGLTYLGQTENWSWGSQLMLTIPLGRNYRGYSLGDRADLTVWGAKKWTEWLSTSLRVRGQIWGDIDGRDDSLNPGMVPTADPDLQDGRRVDLLLGANLYGRSGWVEGHRLAVEFGVPIYQWLDGPQLETDWLLTAGWQYAW